MRPRLQLRADRVRPDAVHRLRDGVLAQQVEARLHEKGSSLTSLSCNLSTTYIYCPSFLTYGYDFKRDKTFRPHES